MSRAAEFLPERRSLKALRAAAEGSPAAGNGRLTAKTRRKIEREVIELVG